MLISCILFLYNFHDLGLKFACICILAITRNYSMCFCFSGFRFTIIILLPSKFYFNRLNFSLQKEAAKKTSKNIALVFIDDFSVRLKSYYVCIC